MLFMCVQRATATALCVKCSHFTHETLCMRARNFNVAFNQIYSGQWLAFTHSVNFILITNYVWNVHFYDQYENGYVRSRIVRLSCISLLLIVIAVRSHIKTQSERASKRNLCAKMSNFETFQPHVLSGSWALASNHTYQRQFIEFNAFSNWIAFFNEH